MERINGPDTRTQILYTAVEMIGKEKILDPTIREIASRAGVNVAAINYYFHSKTELFEEAEIAMGHMLTEKYNILENINLPVDLRVAQWAEGMMEFILEYP